MKRLDGNPYYLAHIPEGTIKSILLYLKDNPDGVSVNRISRFFKINRQMLGAYLQAYEEIGVLRRYEIGPAYVYRPSEMML